jgi:type II secretory pathway component GspD/PulD (secretin)
MNFRFLILAVVILGILVVDLHSAPVPISVPVEKKESPKTVVKYGLKDKKWREVFEWLAETTGKPIITNFYPVGTFTLAGPADKEYTIPEVIDLINDALLSVCQMQTYYLVSRQRSYTLIPADENIDMAGLLPRVLPEELENHGNTELVTTVIPLKSLKAEQIAPYLKKMTGPFGEVAPMTHAGVNQLIILDSVRNLKQIRKKIEELEKTN